MSKLMRIVRCGWIAAVGAVAIAASPSLAQMQTIDPNAGIDADLAQPAETPGEPTPYDNATTYTPAPPADAPADVASDWTDPVVTSQDPSAAASQAASQPAVAAAQGDTYKKDDLIGAAEGVFGKGAEGLARMIEDVLKKQGEPNAYIVGREAGGAFVVGARYGSGTLYHKVEGQKPVYWTGPSMPGPMQATRSCWSTTSTTVKNCSSVIRRAKARPMSSAGSMLRTCARATWC